MSVQKPLRGAIPSPRSALAAATPYPVLVGAPPNFITVPAQLSMWGNDVHGDCVTAEEAFAKACNNPEIFITESEVISWATRHGVLEGAVIVDVLQWMQNDGFQQGDYTYDDGPHFSVNWTNSATLQSAIANGPVKIGVAADQLENAWRSTGGQNGWFATGFHADGNEDHNPSLCGYGSIAWLAQQLHVQVPAGVDGTKTGYALFTWDSIGIIDEPSLLAITHEAWLRQPTTVQILALKPQIKEKAVLPELAIGAPALASVGNDRLVVAWTGTDDAHSLNVALSGDGQSFTGKQTLGDTSITGPALAYGNGRTFLAWAGTDQAHSLNVISSPAGQGWGNKVTLHDNSPFGPALAFGNGRLFLAWTGSDNNHSLNVMSSADGIAWANKVTLGDNSVAAPGLAFLNGKLYLLWSGTDGNHSLNIMESTDGMHFANKVTLGDSSDAGPALAGTQQFPYALFWTGRDNEHHLNVLAGPDVHNLRSKVTYGDTSVAAPAIAAFREALYLGWTGTDQDHHVNVARLG
jgi:hypothetical protein